MPPKMPPDDSGCLSWLVLFADENAFLALFYTAEAKEALSPDSIEDPSTDLPRKILFAFFNDL